MIHCRPDAQRLDCAQRGSVCEASGLQVDVVTPKSLHPPILERVMAERRSPSHERVAQSPSVPAMRRSLSSRRPRSDISLSTCDGQIAALGGRTRTREPGRAAGRRQGEAPGYKDCWAADSPD